MATHNRFGWCFRCDKGFGRRSTPYFETEKDADAFMDWLLTHSGKYKHNHVVARLLRIGAMDSTSWAIGPEDYDMDVVVQMTKDFKQEMPATGIVLCAPQTETVVEFFGGVSIGLTGTSEPDRESRPEQAPIVESDEEDEE